MSIFNNLFRQPPPPPKPFYKKQPIATATFVFMMVCTLVLGPVGVIYKGMSEELKQKVDNKTLMLMIEKDRDALKRHEIENKDQDSAILENQKAIRDILMQKQALPVQMQLQKKTLTPEMFTQYYTMKDADIKLKYKKYLEGKGYDVSGLE